MVRPASSLLRVEAVWAVTRKEWNRLMHAANGNVRRLIRLWEWLREGRGEESFGVPSREGGGSGGGDGGGGGCAVASIEKGGNAFRLFL